MKSVTISTLALALLVSGIPEARAAEGAPTQFVKEKTRTIRKVLKRRPKKGTKAYNRKKQDVKQQVNAFLDFEVLSQRSLRDHWDKRSEAEQQEFVQLLRDLVEESYLTHIDENPDFEMCYREEKTLKSGKAIVRTTAKKGKTVVEIDYKLMPKDSGWIVYDMVIDDVSVERNYRRQFNKIIKKDGYPHLLGKMRSKLDELRSGGKASAPGKDGEL